MNTHLTYFLILSCSLAGPFLLSFDKKVAFYKKWKYLFPALLFPALFYIVWDICFTQKGVWEFNEKYITGIKLINLPIEEILFFFIVPYCCVFIYECLGVYFPKGGNKKAGDIILKILSVLLVITGMFFYDKYYTSWAFILTAVYIVMIFIFRNYFRDFRATLFLITYCVVLIPFLIVNGLLTAIPVVLYNDVENLGIRISSIPFEDIFYGMLLMLMNVTLYERFKNYKKR